MAAEMHDVLYTFGSQLDTMVEKHHDFGLHPEEISKRFDDLRGHELPLINALGKAVVERIWTLAKYDLKDEAWKIVNDRQGVLQEEDSERLAQDAPNLLQHMSEFGDY